jgi:YggT family protein
MLSQALLFLVETVLGLFGLALLMRFYLQLVRAPYRNPLSQFITAITDFAVLPARRIIPGLWGMDLATLALAWLIQFVELFLVRELEGRSLGAMPGLALTGLALLAVVMLFKTSVYILMVAVLVQAVLSWVNPHTPIAPVLDALTRPFLGPIQRRLPPLGGVDLSPLFLLIALQLVLMLPTAWLELNISKIL